MSKHIQLSIADPCHENWDNMSQAEQGRFCGSCQKQVVDFTSMSDSQLAAFFKKPSTGSVCGRFYQDQLDRDVEIPKKRIPWVKYFFQFALPAFLMSAKASAQGKINVKRTEVTVAPPQPMMGMVAIPSERVKIFQKINIKGKITDEKNNPVPFATIMIKGTTIGVSADSIGMFKLDNMVLQTGILLEISSVGYETKEIIITKETDLANELVIRLNAKVLENVTVNPAIVMGGIRRVSCTSTKTMEKMITEVAEVKPKPVTETQPMIKVYPNPVLSGTSINIGCEKLEEGYYTFQLFNQSGQQVQSKQIWIDAEARILNMEIPSVATGNYLLTLTNKLSGKKFTEKIIVE